MFYGEMCVPFPYTLFFRAAAKIKQNKSEKLLSGASICARGSFFQLETVPGTPVRPSNSISLVYTHLSWIRG